MRAAIVALVLAGCTQIINFGEPPALVGLVSLAVSPAAGTVTIAGLDEPPQTVAFTATGSFSDGTTRDVSSQVSWAVDNPLPGAIAADGTYSTSDAAGGHVTVSASSGSATATASLTVVIDATIVDSTFPPPGDPNTLFPAGVMPIVGDATHGPSVLYPVDGTTFPQGVASTLVQYAPGSGNDTFRIGFDSDVLHLAVFTGGPRWAATGAVWSLIAASGIDDPLTLVVEATASTAPGTIYASAPAMLDFSRDAPGGLIYYWSAATNGIMRGSLGALAAGKLYPSDATCVGCHAVSRDGVDLAMGYGNENNPLLQTITLADLTTVIGSTANLAAGWSTYSPDDALVLTAHNGVLALYNAHTGAPVGTPNGVVMLPPMTFATHPDWSPDGTAVAVAITSMMPNDKNVNGASIALLPFSGGQLGAPKVLVAATSSDNNYFPRWSPDGRYLAYVHATMSSQGAQSAELRLVPASGGTPTVLNAASYRTTATGPAMGLADTMPVWAPTQGERSWLAFASVRPYGAVMPMPMTNTAQIWIAALDLSRLAGGGSDPSATAFWLPCQDVTQLNNNPVWSPPLTTGVEEATRR